jgi:hypothetical protein
MFVHDGGSARTRDLGTKERQNQGAEATHEGEGPARKVATTELGVLLPT